MTDVAVSRLRVGLLGCGRFGMHLIERSAVGGPFQVVAACDADPRVGDLIAPFGVRLVSLPDLARAADVDVVWVTTPFDFPAEFSEQSVGYRHQLIAETPFSLDFKASERAFVEAAQQDRLLLIHHPRRADMEFRQALAVARDEKIGTIRAAKFVSWSYGLPPREATRSIDPPFRDETAQPHATKVRCVAHALDQLVMLIPSRPIRVAATGDLGVSDLLVGHSLLLRIVFDSGCLAEIDIRLDSPTPFQSGWTLTSEWGGYAKGRQYTLTDDGEIFDSPVTVSEDDAEADQFDWLAREIRSGTRNGAEEIRARTVISLLDAVQRSLNTNQEATLQRILEE